MILRDSFCIKILFNQENQSRKESGNSFFFHFFVKYLFVVRDQLIK